jgi:hypothetical protein
MEPPSLASKPFDSVYAQPNGKSAKGRFHRSAQNLYRVEIERREVSGIIAADPAKRGAACGHKKVRNEGSAARFEISQFS